MTAVEKLFFIGILLFLVFVSTDWNLAKSALYFATLIAVVGLIIDRKKLSPLNNLEWAFFLVILLLLLQGALSWWANGFPEHGLVHIKNRQAKLLLLIPLYLFVRKNGLSIPLFCVLIIIGGFMAGLDGFIEFARNDFQLWKRLREGEQFTIHYAFITASFAVILSVLGICFFSEKKIFGSLLLIVSLFVSIGVLVSGTRGVWLALFLVFVVTLLVFRPHLGAKLMLIMSALLIILSIILYQQPYIKGRIHQIFVELQAYGDTTRTTSSIGSRIDMWKAAWQMGTENLVFGVGPGGFNAAAKKGIGEKKWAAHLARYEYPHNQYMATFATRGLPGLLLLMLSLGIPAYLFFKYYKKIKGASRFLALSGLMLIFYVAICFLTYDHLEKRFQVSLFATILALLMGMLQAQTNNRNDLTNPGKAVKV